MKIGIETGEGSGMNEDREAEAEPPRSEEEARRLIIEGDTIASEIGFGD